MRSALLLVVVMTAVAVGCSSASSTGAAAGDGSVATIQGDRLAVTDITGPAVVFVWEPG